MKRALLVSAHPDDMEIGMGGTAAKMAAGGDKLFSVVMTDGRRAPDPTGVGPERMTELRKQEGEAAARVLGIADTEFFGLESLSFHDVCDAARSRLVELIKSFQPDEIYTLHPELDRHSSHREAGKVSIEAVEEVGSNIPVWAYEVWGLFAEWDRVDDISDHIGTKLAAIKEHQSQLAAIEYDEGVAGLNRWRAVFADTHQEKSPAKFAEVFVRLR